MSNARRIEALERALGSNLPEAYRAFLQEHRWKSLQPEWGVRADPDRWGIQGLFELGSGPPYAQADEAYRLICDVLPPGFSPIGDDSGGNLYVIDCRLPAGPVFWWDHEKSALDGGLEAVAETFHAFLADIGPED